MNWKNFVAFGCVLSLAATGCSDDGDGGGGGGSGGEGQSYAAFQESAEDEYVDILCSSVYDCPEKQSPFYVVFAGRFSDKQDCLANAGQLMNFDGDDRQTAAIEAGRAEFDPAKAQACLSEIRSLGSTCVAITEVMGVIEGGACESILVAQQAMGEACLVDEECQTGHCDFSQTTECYGTCAEAPTPVGEGGNCDSAPCQDGFACLYDSDSFESVCVAEKSRAAGEACNLSADICQEGLVCGLEETCTEPLTYRASGESCDNSSEVCQPGLVCVLGDTGGTCNPPLAQGEACQATFQCHQRLFCDSEGSGNCEQPRGQGESCDSGETCASGLMCEYGGESATCEPETSETCEIPGEGDGGDTDAGGSLVDAGSSESDAGM